MFQRLLIPVDFGTCSDEAIRFAKKIAKPGAKVRLLHVITNETTLFFADLLSLDRFVERAQKGLAERKTGFEDQDFRIETELREGTIYKEILGDADDFAPEVIVLGSHGRRGLQKLLLGSVAEHVLRASKLPVCVVKGEPPHSEGLAKVALATSMEETMEEATGVFRSLLQETGAQGHLLHAFHAEHWLSMASVPAPFVEAGQGAGAVPDTEIENRLRARRLEREEELSRLAASLRGPGVQVHHRLLDGEPWDEIADFVEAEGADLLILGTHKYKALDRFVLGSVAEKTVRTVECPVLVVPHHS